MFSVPPILGCICSIHAPACHLGSDKTCGAIVCATISHDNHFLVCVYGREEVMVAGLPVLFCTLPFVYHFCHLLSHYGKTYLPSYT